MIYTQFVSIPDGQYHFVKKPYMEGYIVHDVDCHPSQLATVKKPYIIGIDKRNKNPLKESLSNMDNQSMFDNGFIICETLDDVYKERAKIIHHLQMDLKNHFNDILNKFENEIRNTKHYELLEKYPEVMV